MDWQHTYSRNINDHLHRYHYLHRRLRRGIGLGWGNRYVPWVTVRQVKDGKGRTPHVPGIKVDRIHHLLSMHEHSFFCMAERWPWVIDIREQWPILDFDATNQLHFDRGIPVPQRGGFPQPATLDFLLTENTKDGIRCRAVAIKPDDLARRKKTMLYLDVQRAWCEQNHIPFTVVGNTGGMALYETMTELRKWFDDGYQPSADRAEEFQDRFQHDYREFATLAELLLPFATSMHMDRAEAFSMFRYAAWSNKIKLNLHKPIALNEAVVLAA